MTDNILSQSDGSANLPGQGGRMHGGKISPDTNSRPSKTAQAMPEMPGHRRSWRPIVIGLASLAAAGIAFLLYQDQRVDRATMTNAAATRVNELKRAETQARELDAARRAMEAQTAARVVDDEATKEMTERPATELEQALTQERDKTEKLTRELAATRRVLETQTTASAEAGAKTADNSQLAILKRALQEAEESAVSYQELLAQERARTRSLEQQLLAQQETAPDPASNETAERSDSSAATPVQGSDKSAAAPLPSDDKPLIVASADDKVVTATPSVTREEPGNPKATRLMARANQLLAMGDVAAARIVLDRAAELGNAQALFALAETYDPFSLSAWGTLGTQADATKAQELYAKALAAGIQKARDRIDALRK
jgi:hypothetical protein